MTIPAPTPAEKTLKRVLVISALDAWSILAIATLGILLALALGDLSSVGVGLLIVAASIIELRGRRQLLRRNAGGMRLLIRAQMFLLAVILVYCASRLGSFDETVALGNLTPEMEALLKENGIGRADIAPAVRMAFYALYGTLAFVTLLFQGGLSLYYRSRIPQVTAALATPPLPPQTPLA